MAKKVPDQWQVFVDHSTPYVVGFENFPDDTNLPARL